MPDSPLPGSPGAEGLSAETFRRAQTSPEFVHLKRTFRSFAFPMTLAFLVWYLVYVLLSTYWVGLMATKLFGYINLGLVISLGQFVTTFLITWLYVRHANTHLDPQAEAIRAELEDGSL